MLQEDDPGQAESALQALPEPPADLTYEALTCLEAAAALQLDMKLNLRRIHARLAPARNELAGAATGLFTAGPITTWLARIEKALAT